MWSFRFEPEYHQFECNEKRSVNTHTVTRGNLLLKIPKFDIFICATTHKTTFVWTDLDRPNSTRMGLNRVNQGWGSNIIYKNFSTFRSDDNLVKAVKIRKGEARWNNRQTCLSPGRNVLQTACPQSMVLIHEVVLRFHILREPFEAEASIWSLELRQSDRTSVLWPGRSTLKERDASGSSSLDFVGGGTWYTSMAFVFRATKSYTMFNRLMNLEVLLTWNPGFVALSSKP